MSLINIFIKLQTYGIDNKKLDNNMRFFNYYMLRVKHECLNIVGNNIIFNYSLFLCIEYKAFCDTLDIRPFAKVI